MKNLIFKIIIAATVSAIMTTPLGTQLESTMVTHVLVELPLLVIAGMLLGKQYSSGALAVVRHLNHGGIFGLLSVTFVLAFWMIPRWLDASLNEPLVAYAKYASMIVVGVMLSISWPKAHIITRALVKIEFITMLLRLGWIYLISPERLCSNYLLNDQVLLGQGFIYLGLVVAIIWMIPVFFGNAHDGENANDRSADFRTLP